MNCYNLIKYINNLIFDLLFMIISLMSLMIGRYVISKENVEITEGFDIAYNIIFVSIVICSIIKFLYDVYEYIFVHKDIIEKVCEENPKKEKINHV